MKKKHPRIAMLGPMPPASGGVCTNIQNILKSPLTEKYDFLIFQTSSPKYGTLGYCNEKLPEKLLRFFKNACIYFFFLIKYSPDIVHVNPSFGSYSFWRASFFALVAKVFGRRVVFQIHGGTLYEFQDRYSHGIRNLVLRILKIPDRIIVLSSVQKEALSCTDQEDKIKIVPNMIDAGDFKMQKKCRNRFDINLNHIVVLFVAAHFYKEKGVWDIIKAIPHIIDKYKNALFVLVGGGEEEKPLREYCTSEKLSKYVRFTGYLNRNDIIKIFLSSDIFVLPTYYSEGFPLVILEAMAAGLPVIATPIRAIPDIIDNGVNGFLIQPRKPLILANKIIELIKNKTLRREMGSCNRTKVKENYDLNPVAQIFDNIYSELLSERS